jgi:hypothetical protein
MCLLVVTGPARGQVWIDDRGADAGIDPETDFTDWYLGWLANPRWQHQKPPPWPGH